MIVMITQTTWTNLDRAVSGVDRVHTVRTLGCSMLTYDMWMYVIVTDANGTMSVSQPFFVGGAISARPKSTLILRTTPSILLKVNQHIPFY